MDFCRRFQDHFIGQGRNSTQHARHYISGLMGTQRRKNIETFENDVSGSDYQGMEQFISSSPWSHRALLDDIAVSADTLLGDPENTGFNIDECTFLKKGKASVGVARQWSGRIGKVDNCQVGVFASLGRDTRYCLADFELYLPESWTSDPARCNKAKIPEEQRTYKPKWKLALEMIARARENGIRFGWVGADSLYGHNNQFLRALEDSGQHYMCDVHKDYMMWTEKPATTLAKAKTNKGRPPSRQQLDEENNTALHTRADELAQAGFEENHQVVTYRQGAKGKLCKRIWSMNVWIWDKSRGGEPRERRFIVSQDESGDFKYSISNLPDKGLERDAYVQGQRFWIEHAFHEAKSQLGMAQYQVRVWQGWHHHMALVVLSTLFVAEEKERTKEEVPLLSYRDITELLDYYLPRRGREESEVHERIKKRHETRKRDLDRRRNKTPGIPPGIQLTK